MSTVPFALSLHSYFDSVGADAGYAALLGLTLLVLLYFAQMRETATLRERLDEAYGRVGNLEARIAQLTALQARAQQAQAARPGVTPAPSAAAARPMGTAVASVRRIPASGPAPAVATNGLLPAASAGTAAPALASATKVIPDPAPPATAGPGQNTVLIRPGVEAPAAAGGGVATPAGAVASSTAGGAPAAANGADQPVAGGVPPRVQIRPDTPTGAAPRRAAIPPRPLIEPPRERDTGRRVLAVIGALVAVAAIVVVLLAITGKGGSPSTPAATTTKHKSRTTAAATFHPSKVVVAVLNGTSVGGLAGDAGKVLTGKGYNVPATEITDATVQDQQVTLVSYVKGAPNSKSDAKHVARALGVKPSNVQVANQTDIQNCETSYTTGTTTSCEADVIVVLGLDKVGLASSSGSS